MKHSYLALGDSYTIGEGLPFAENFPSQTTALLRQQNIDLAEPLLIATTGWTTDELAAAIRERALQERFSLVSLLIGVNNQYRGRSLENYQAEFALLLEQAIGFAGGRAARVAVLSIPDWSGTPFAGTEAAGNRNPLETARAIDAYNAAAQAQAAARGCAWLYITDSTRAHASRPDFLAADGLHPSGREYALWAQRLAPVFAAMLAA